MDTLFPLLEAEADAADGGGDEANGKLAGRRIPPNYINDVHPEVAQEIARINAQGCVRGEDFGALRVRSRKGKQQDQASRASMDVFDRVFGGAKVAEIHAWLVANVGAGHAKRSSQESVLRWMLRGLNQAAALEREKLAIEAVLRDKAAARPRRAAPVQAPVSAPGPAVSDLFTPIEEFSYSLDQALAIRRPFDRSLERLNWGAGENGGLYLATEPTGMGKSHATAQALSDAALAAAEAIERGQLAGPRTMLVVVPTFGLANDPLKAVERALEDKTKGSAAREKLRERIDVVLLEGSSRLMEQQGLDALPQGCPVRTTSKDACDALKKYKSAYGPKKGRGKVKKPNPDQLGDIARSAVNKACWEGFSDDAGSPCLRCKFRNPGAMAYKREGDEKTVTIAFVTYSKLLHGMRTMRTDEDTGRPTQTYYAFGKGGNKQKFPPTTFIMEEAVEGFRIIWKHIIDNLSKVDIVDFSEHLITHLNVLSELPSFARRSARGTFRGDPARLATAYQAINTIALALDKEIADYKAQVAQFYIKGVNKTQLIPYDGASDPAARVRLVADSELDQVKNFFQSTDLSFSYLSDTRVEGKSISYAAEQDFVPGQLNMHAVQIGIDHQDGQDVAALVSAYVSRIIRPFVLMVGKLFQAISREVEDDLAVKVVLYRALDTTLNRFFGETGRLRDPHSKRRSFDNMLNAERARRNTGDMVGGPGNYLDAAERLRLSGYNVVKLEYETGWQTYRAMQEIAAISPEGILERLIADGSDVLLVSATVDYPNAIETFSLPFFKGRGIPPIRPEEAHQANLRAAIAHKYAHRPEMQFTIVPELLRREKERPWQLAQKAAFAPAFEAFLRERVFTRPEDLSFDEGTGARDDHPASVLLRFLESLVVEPHRPRMAVALVNSDKQAKCLKLLCDHFAEFAKDRPELEHLTFDIRKESSASLDEDSDEGQQFKEAKEKFTKALVGKDTKKTPVMIVVAPRQSLGVGANLQLRFEKAAVERAIPPLLAAYLNGVGALKVFPGASDVQVDISDMLICLPRTFIVDDDNATMTLMILAADGLVDPALLRYKLGTPASEITRFLKPTAIFAAAQTMAAIQNIGRMDRSPNAPAGQRLWLHKAVADYIGRAPDPLREDGQPTYATPNFKRLLEKIRSGGPERIRAVQTNGLSEKLRGLALMVLGVQGAPTPEAIALWEGLRNLGVRHSAASAAFFNSSEAQRLNALIKTVREQADDDRPFLISIRDLYMEVPPGALCDWTEKAAHLVYDGFASKAKVLFVRAHAAEVEGHDVIANSPALVREQWRDALTMRSRYVAEEVGIPDTAPLCLMRPAAMREIAIAAVDEFRTAGLMRQVPGVSVADLPAELVENVGDHLFLNPNFLVDNKAHSRERYLGHDGPGLIDKMVRDGARKLRMCADWYVANGQPDQAPAMFVYVFRHDPTGRASHKATFRAFRSDAMTHLSEDCLHQADVLFVSMPHEWSVEPFDKLVSLLRSMDRNT